MIRTDEQLFEVQRAIENLERVLAEAKRIHTPMQYEPLSKPILIELQQRQQDILMYLMPEPIVKKELKGNGYFRRYTSIGKIHRI